MWSLRALATGLVGSGARIVSVTGDVTETIGSGCMAIRRACRSCIRLGAERSSSGGPIPTASGARQEVVKDVAKLEIATK